MSGQKSRSAIILAITLGIALIYSIIRSYKTQIESQYLISVLFVLIIAGISAALVYRVGKQKKQRKIPKKDSYHPVNFASHSDFMNKGFLK